MTFEEIVDQAIEMVRCRGQVSYQMLKCQFDLDDTSTRSAPLTRAVSRRRASHLLWLSGGS